MAEKSFPVAGALLVGGRSRRMGRDKYALRLGGMTLARKLAGTLRELTEEVLLVGNRTPEIPGCRREADRHPIRSSLTGLYTALEASRYPLVLVLPCDTPFVELSLLRLLLEAWEPGVDVVVPESPHGLEPLTALYSARLAGAFRERLDAGRPRIGDALEGLVLKRLSWPELQDRGIGLRQFTNLNTPEDFALAEASEGE